MFHAGAKYSTESVKCSMERVKWYTEVLNIPRRGSNVPRRC